MGDARRVFQLRTTTRLKVVQTVDALLPFVQALAHHLAVE
jgi:hypothetical protein